MASGHGGRVLVLRHLLWDRRTEAPRRKPDQQRIAEAEQRFFAEAQPEVEVDLPEANLKREPLTRLALQHGYELERAEKRGSPGSLSSIKYHFVLRGPEAKPPPFLPESHEHEAYKRWETARERRIRLFYAKFYGALIVVVGVLVVFAVR